MSYLSFSHLNPDAWLPFIRVILTSTVALDRLLLFRDGAVGAADLGASLSQVHSHTGMLLPGLQPEPSAMFRNTPLHLEKMNAACLAADNGGCGLSPPATLNQGYF